MKQLNSVVDESVQVPQEICQICQSLMEVRNLFPNQCWLTQFDIFIENLAILHIRARWLTVDKLDQPYLLLLIEDRQTTINKIVSQEAEQYGLTPREREVWLLHRRGRTYKQIALELEITPNTVKKHMKSIHSKRKKVMFSSSVG
ncbi:helix-turn-helix transcriptional regulator [Leptolyngbya sp. Heron Island J]|uniref:helix-turn-helix transcriptional regulator n=1 Tax=Leptolyngbya sp. Heron Island J TaxID=1385935 RepID=UPI00042052D4|nr:LuxR family transcriptional regulator [Leptolyngbya sp. Heron Island J]